MKAPLGSQPVVARRPTGAPQLISYAPLPAVEGTQCEWIPASASGSLLAAMQQERAAGNSGQARLGDPATRAPLRAIRDPYASYSSVAVDPTRNEVVMT